MIYAYVIEYIVERTDFRVFLLFVLAFILSVIIMTVIPKPQSIVSTIPNTIVLVLFGGIIYISSRYLNGINGMADVPRVFWVVDFLIVCHLIYYCSERILNWFGVVFAVIISLFIGVLIVEALIIAVYFILPVIVIVIAISIIDRLATISCLLSFFMKLFENCTESISMAETFVFFREFNDK